MKMSKQHYEYLESKLIPVYKMMLDLPQYATLSEKRFRWDGLYAAKLSPWICANLYPADLNDDHIDTALRKIVKKVR